MRVVFVLFMPLNNNGAGLRLQSREISVRGWVYNRAWSRKGLAMTGPELTPSNLDTTDPQISLTRRERDILRLLAQGLSNKEIAEQLGLSEKTVRNRLSEILSTLGVRNRTQAAIWAKEHGLDNGQQEQS